MRQQESKPVSRVQGDASRNGATDKRAKSPRDGLRHAHTADHRHDGEVRSREQRLASVLQSARNMAATLFRTKAGDAAVPGGARGTTPSNFEDRAENAEGGNDRQQDRNRAENASSEDRPMLRVVQNAGQEQNQPAENGAQGEDLSHAMPQAEKEGADTENPKSAVVEFNRVFRSSTGPSDLHEIREVAGYNRHNAVPVEAEVHGTLEVLHRLHVMSGRFERDATALREGRGMTPFLRQSLQIMRDARNEEFTVTE